MFPEDNTLMTEVLHHPSTLPVDTSFGRQKERVDSLLNTLRQLSGECFSYQLSLAKAKGKKIPSAPYLTHLQPSMVINSAFINSLLYKQEAPDDTNDQLSLILEKILESINYIVIDLELRGFADDYSHDEDQILNNLMTVARLIQGAQKQTR